MHEITGWFHFMFNPQGVPWYTGGFYGNQTQWTIVWIPSLIFIFYKARKCSACWRVAHHPVKGTHYKTCHKHTNKFDHDRLQAKHKKKHPKEHAFLKGK